MNILVNYFHFDLDPCPVNWDGSFDGLQIPWKDKNYVNCPYSKKLAWVKKAKIEQDNGKMSVFFLPVDTSTQWYHDWIFRYSMVLWIRGRVTSDLGKTPAFSSLLAIFFPYDRNAGTHISWNPKKQSLNEVLQLTEQEKCK